MLRVFEDPDDRLDTVIQINCLANRQAGVLVGHAAPPGMTATLPQDLLLALGHSDRARGWPRSPQTAWPLARAWMSGFQINHLIIYGAWRLTDSVAETLAEIATIDHIDVSIVTLATMRDRLVRRFAELPVAPVNTLIEQTAVTSRAGDRTVPGLPVALPAGLPPLPPADSTCFRSACAGCIREVGLWLKFGRVLDGLIDSTRRRLGDANSAERVLEVLEEQLRQARDSNEFIVGARAFQIAALQSGWHVRIPLHDVALAIAMALNTAAADHEWPLDTDVRPQPQALAALAWATRCSATELAAVKIDDVHPHYETLAGRRIDATMRPAIRAQVRLRQYRGCSPSDLLCCNPAGRALRPDTVQEALDAVAPTAFNATELGPDTVRRALGRMVDITRVASDGAAGEWTNASFPALLPTASYTGWALANGGSGFLERTGLPPGHERLANNARGFAQAVAAATGLHKPAPWPRNDRGSPTQGTPAHEQPAADGARLHSVLLQTGWGADRLTLIQGLDWSAERLHTAERTLRRQLIGTAELLASTLDGRLELRVRSDDETAVAVQTVLKQDNRDRDLSNAGARLVHELLDSTPHGLALDDIQMPRHIAQAAIQELQQRRLITITNYARISLTNGVRHNLGGWEREPMRATSDCR